MDTELLRHLLQLAQRTGDRLIVVDPDSRQPFVLMGIAQYEALLPRADDRGAESAADGRFRYGASELGMETQIGAPAVAPGLDSVAQRANAELAAWRASQPAVIPEQPAAATVEGFAPEPMQPVSPPDEDRFYVEPLE